MIQTGSYGGVHTTRRESLRNERDFFVQQGERVSEMNAIFFGVFIVCRGKHALWGSRSRSNSFATLVVTVSPVTCCMKATCAFPDKAPAALRAAGGRDEDRCPATSILLYFLIQSCPQENPEDVPVKCKRLLPQLERLACGTTKHLSREERIIEY